MKTLFTSDLHGNETVYSKLFNFIKEENIKNVILGGDLCPHSSTSIELAVRIQKGYIEWLIKKIKESNAKFFVMLGNDDFRINAKLLEKAEDEGIISYIHKNAHEVDGYTIVGYSFVSQMPFLLKDWEKLDDSYSKQITNERDDIRTMPKEEGTIAEDMKIMAEVSKPKKTVYAMHCPPFNTNLDLTTRGSHVGSRAIRKFIEEEQPLLTLHGHIHESFDMSGSYLQRIRSTACVNPGSSHLKSKMNCIVFELEDLESLKHCIL